MGSRSRRSTGSTPTDDAGAVGLATDAIRYRYPDPNVIRRIDTVTGTNPLTVFGEEC